MECSPDGIAVLKVDELSSRYGTTLEQSTAGIPPWCAREGAVVLQGVNCRLVLAPVEIKASFFSSSLQRLTFSASVDVDLCEIGDPRFKELISEPRAGKVLHQTRSLR